MVKNIMNERIKKIEFTAILKWPHLTVENVKCFIEIDQLSYGAIKGYFICTDERSAALIKDDNIFRAYFTIEPQFQHRYSNTYRMARCHLYKHAGGEVRKFFFDCQELEDRQDKPLPSTSETESINLHFYVNAHPLLHPPIWLESSCDGSRSRKDKEKKFTIFNDDDILIEIALNYDSINFKVDAINGNFESVEKVLLVTINKKMAIDKALDNAEKLIYNLLMLFSFCAQKRISVYKFEYYVYGNDNCLLYHSEILNGKNRIDYSDSDTEDCIFRHFYDFYPFIQKAFPVFLAKKKSYNIEEAIWSYVGSFERDSFESSFMALCTSLEAIKDGYLNSNKNRFMLSNKQQENLIKKLRSEIKTYVSANSIDDTVLNNLLESLNGIKNPSFRLILSDLFSNLNINISDLEPSKIFNFISFRNELFHKGKIKDKDDEQLIIEKDRLQILIERIMLRIFDYPDVPCVARPDRPLETSYFSKDRFIK